MTNSFLLINPEALAYQTHYDIFRVVHQTRIKDKPGFNFDSRIIPNLRAIYSGSNPAVAELLRNLDASRIKNEMDKLAKVHAKQKGGISFETYIERAAPRMFYELFGHLTAASSELKLYHRIKNRDTGNYKVAPCALSNNKTKLSFHINKVGGRLHLVPMVEINGEQSELASFDVFAFLLEKNGVYHTLSPKDSQTIDWLVKANPNQYAADPVAFADKIISVLERDYEVVKDQVFKVNVIDLEPQHAVYLSEISDTYLMLTPRWDYEGFIVESTDEAELEEMRNGELYRIIRHKETENGFVEKLRALHPNFEKQRNGQFYLSFDDAKKKHWFLKVYQSLLADNVQVVGMDMLRHFRYSPHSIHTEMAIGRTIDSDLHLNIKVTFGEEKIELSHIQRTLYNGQKFILLKDNSIGVITDEWYEQYGNMFKHGRIQQGELVVPQWILLSIDERYRAKELKPVIAHEWWADWQRWQTSTDTMISAPADLKASLRPYQQKGFEWMVLLSRIGAGACLADDMGLGKTLQTITFLLHTHAENKNARFLILAPLSLVFNWKEELAKFAPSLGVYVYHQANRSIKEFMQSDARVMISSYGTARSAVDDLSLVQWHTMVIDESHNIKNPTAQITKAVYKLSALNRIALSGTPVMNNTFDIYSQLNFLLPGLLGGPEFFKREYALPIDRDQSVEKTNALQKMTAPFILRRTKKQVASDLPDKTETVLWCQMEDEQREAYETIKNQIKSSVFLNIEREGFAKAKFSILQGIMKLRQICCAPTLLKDEEITATASIKLDMLMQELKENVGGSKSLVFSQYLGMLQLVAKQCEKEGIPYLYFDGSTTLDKRAEMVASFQDESSENKVFLISLKAGNAGLNLTAAEYVFLLDPWWNNAVEQQAIDRTHRIGQTKNIFAYKLICRGTIEERIIELQQRKRQLSEDLVTEEDGFVKQLSQEDITFLFD